MKKTTGVGLFAALALAGCFGLNRSTGVSRSGACDTQPMRLACQMWSVKDFWDKDPEKGFAEVFPRLRAMGYEGVQSMAF